jgi:hypothetical protein
MTRTDLSWGAMKRVGATLGLIFLAGCSVSTAPRNKGAAVGRAPMVVGKPGVAHLYLPGRTTQTKVHYQTNARGLAITEGDIALGPADQLQALYGFPRFSNASHATATSNKSHLWPGAIIPFEIDANVSASRRSIINAAVAHVSSESVVKLRPRTAADEDFVRFTEDPTDEGCYSYVGRIGSGQQLNTTGCQAMGMIAHEILHAAGFYHEHQRTDRDQYITIVWDEMEPAVRDNFQIPTNSTDIGPYDYDSIMHYPRKAGSRSGADTIIPKNPNATIGRYEALSTLDKAGLAQLYGGGPTIGTSTESTGGQQTIQIPGLPPIPVPAGVPGLPGFPVGTPGPSVPMGGEGWPAWPTGLPDLSGYGVPPLQ